MLSSLDIHGGPEAIWRPWAAGELHSRPIHSGHHQAEEAPDELALALLDFLKRDDLRSKKRGRLRAHAT